MSEKAPSLAKRGLLALQLLLLGIWCLGPFLWALSTSLKPQAQLTRLPPLLPDMPTTEHYVSIFLEY